MAPRSKLKIALAAEKGLTDKKVKQLKDKKKHKAVIKDKRKKGLIPEEEEQDWEDEDDSEGEDGEGLLDIEAEESDEDEDDDESVYEEANAAAILNESDTDSESEVDMEEKIERKPKSILKKTENRRKQRLAEAQENDDEAEEESDIALSDLEDLPEEEREDLFVKTKLSINNQPALLAAVKRISIPKDSSTSFTTHQTLVSSEPTEPKIEDISDDLQRELQLYAQSLEAAKKARALLRAEGLPFSRPKDYFAEMVKDDGHMEKVKAKLIEEATAKKASAEARKLRDLKKFGKQVQVAKLQERHKEKRETLEKIKALKKKRAENGGELDTNEADLFDVGVDNELNKPGKRGRSDQGSRTPNHKRAKKDAKFGFGGKKKYAKSGTAESSGDVSGFSAKGMKGKGGPKKIMKTARLGKAKRKTVAGRR
ncbi:rrna processing protein [Diaporthe amygdali]|uniref:rrna processing protein n=1 Tax=Phomopsis amygdali TaxID=1214568 RepID=UPI0022FF42B0|nr:rrna processing protein [Diaporthe amygdali]KAJ0117605.1 rrna processing protein [Diaporthe amygdali]